MFQLITVVVDNLDETLTVHSGILKCNGDKSYHAYLSNDRLHYQFFVDIVTREMLQEAEIPTGGNAFIVMETDNCASQYNSSVHFDLVQRLADELKCRVIRIFSIPEHGKGEVDHVGGITRTAIASGEHVADSHSALSLLQERLGKKESPRFFFKYIRKDALQQRRDEGRLKIFNKVDGSSAFQVMVFTPGSKQVKAAPHLCGCVVCEKEYGSCPPIQQI